MDARSVRDPEVVEVARRYDRDVHPARPNPLNGVGDEATGRVTVEARVRRREDGDLHTNSAAGRKAPLAVPTLSAPGLARRASEMTGRHRPDSRSGGRKAPLAVPTFSAPGLARRASEMTGRHRPDSRSGGRKAPLAVPTFSAPGLARRASEMTGRHKQDFKRIRRRS